MAIKVAPCNISIISTQIREQEEQRETFKPTNFVYQKLRMAVTIDMVRNVLTNKYLTNDGSTISFHNTEADPGE